MGLHYVSKMVTKKAVLMDHHLVEKRMIARISTWD